MNLALQLISAIRLKDDGKVSELLERMDVDEVNRKENGDTALHVACRGSNEALDLLLKKTGIDVNVKGGSNFTPLHIACRLENNHAVKRILTSPEVDVNAKTISERTPLHFACISNYHQIVSQLLASPGIEVNVKDNLGKTAIMYSAGHCHKEALKLMLEDPRVDFDVLDDGGRRLEAQVGRYGGKQKQKCSEMINNKRKKRENRQIEQEQPSQGGKQEQPSEDGVGNVGIGKVEILNKQIADGEKRRLKNLKDRKRKGQDLNERQTLEMKRLNKQSKEEETMMVKKHKEVNAMLFQKHEKEGKILVDKHKEEVAVLENTLVREDQVEQHHIAVLKECRDELAKDLQETVNDPRGDASSEDDNKLAAAKRSLECPICYDLMRPPTRIWMCRLTHIICQFCKDLLNDGCPTCTNERVTQRAFMAENFARTIFNE